MVPPQLLSHADPARAVGGEGVRGGGRAGSRHHGCFGTRRASPQRAALGAAYVLCRRVDDAVRLLEQALEKATSSGRSGRMDGQARLLFTQRAAYLGFPQ